MSLKKLAAGSGYEYLTDQVAAYDTTEVGRTPLADYYAAKDEAPGLWIGSGLVGIEGPGHGDVVTAEQMEPLFGERCHRVTGAALERAFQDGSVAGFDLTFSPAKSVSTGARKRRRWGRRKAGRRGRRSDGGEKWGATGGQMAALRDEGGQVGRHRPLGSATICGVARKHERSQRLCPEGRPRGAVCTD
jgi:hypothetical protein